MLLAVCGPRWPAQSPQGCQRGATPLVRRHGRCTVSATGSICRKHLCCIGSHAQDTGCRLMTCTALLRLTSMQRAVVGVVLLADVRHGHRHHRARVDVLPLPVLLLVLLLRVRHGLRQRALRHRCTLTCPRLPTRCALHAVNKVQRLRGTHAVLLPGRNRETVRTTGRPVLYGGYMFIPPAIPMNCGP